MTKARDLASIPAGSGDFSVDSNTLFVDASADAVGIGTDSPACGLHIDNPSNGAITQILDTDNTAVKIVFRNTSETGNNLQIGADGSDLVAFTGGSERMRLDNSGDLLLGNAVSNGSGGVGFSIVRSGGLPYVISNTSSTSRVHNYFQYNSGTVGTISTTTTSTAYNTSSDYRLKENVVDMTGAIDRVKALKPSQFNFIVDPDTTVDGFLAHEVQDIVPEAVTGEKDGMRTEEYVVSPALGEIFVPAIDEVLDEEGNVITEAQDEQIVSSNVEQPETLEEDQQWRETNPAVMGEREVPDYQGIDQSKLVPLLTGALQEAIARIETLEAEVATLKAI